MHLDFLHPVRRASAVGWLLLILGLLALAAALAWNLLELAPQLVLRESEVRRLERTLQAREPVVIQFGDKQLAVEWTQASKVAQDLAAPWSELFAVLEKAADQPIALLGVEPDRIKNELVLTGEARHYAALLDYYRFLQQQPMLTNVVLQTHQVNKQDSDKPVRFRITAHWERAA